MRFLPPWRDGRDRGPAWSLAFAPPPHPDPTAALRRLISRTAMRPKPPAFWLAFAIVATALAMVARLRLGTLFGDQPALAVLVVPILLSAYLGGWKPGVLATGAAALAAAYFLLPPLHSLRIASLGDQADCLGLIATGGMASVLTGTIRSVRARVEQSHAEHAATLDTSGDGILVADSAGRVTFINTEAEQLTGHARDQAVGAPLATILRIVDQQTRQARIDCVISLCGGGAAQELSGLLLLARNGREIPVELRAAPMGRGKDGPSGVVLVLRDRSESQRSEAAFRASEARFRSYIDSSPIAIFVADREGYIVEVNPAAATLFGYDRANLLRMHVKMLPRPDNRQAFLADYAALKRDGAVEREYAMARPDGGTVWVLFRAVGTEDGGIIGFCQDISRRVATEEELRRSEDRFELAMRGARAGVWDWDLTNDNVFFSPRWKAILGYGPDELPDTLETFTGLLHSDDREPVMALNPGVAVWGPEGELEVEFRMRHKDGHYVDILARSYPVHDKAGKIVRLVGTHQDISARKRQEQQLRQAAMVYANTQEGVVVTDARANILAVNPAFSRISGYPESELLGRNMTMFHSGRHDQSFYEEMWDALLKQNRWEGEIWDRRKSGEIYPLWLSVGTVRDDHGEVVNFVGTAIDITRVKESEARLEQLAHHDSLTGLPNRLVLLTRLGRAIAQAKRNGTRGAVLFLDLDRFKNVNDSLGHPAGDELLELVARRLASRLRGADTLARLGGDEFVVLVEELADAQDAARIAQSLIDQVAAPFTLTGGREVYVGASIGISLVPDDGENPDQLIQHADAALYQAKSGGRNTYRFFAADMTRAAIERLELEGRLRRAVQRDELVLHFQPLVAMGDRRIIGVEALVRWQDPQYGLIPPGRFIPVAEETGLILQIGHWVLRAACTQMKAWREAGIAPETIAVNLSPRQFQEPSVVETIDSILAETGLPASCLELEITESVLMEHAGEAEAKLKQLKALGVRLAIDDFGTGYSSLAYLKRFPIDTLKVDQSFVRGIPDDHADMEITTAIIALAKNLQLDVLAEGVESAEQLDFLLRNGCAAGQGYLFSRPLAREDIEKTLAADRRGEPAPARGHDRREPAVG